VIDLSMLEISVGSRENRSAPCCAFRFWVFLNQRTHKRWNRSTHFNRTDRYGPPTQVTPDGKGGSVYIWERWVDTGYGGGHLWSTTSGSIQTGSFMDGSRDYSRSIQIRIINRCKSILVSGM